MNSAIHMLSSKLLIQFPEITHGFGTRNSKNISKLNFVKQIHSIKIRYIELHDQKKEADGILTKRIDFPIGIKTADCLPILLFESKKKIIEIVHAGWKGTVNGILREAIKNIVFYGGQVTNVFVSFGPAIEFNCYDIPDERARFIIEKLGSNRKFIKKTKGRYYFNLLYANYDLLRKLGVPKNHIELNEWCTLCNDLFYSRRRDKGSETGHNISFIQLN